MIAGGWRERYLLDWSILRTNAYLAVDRLDPTNDLVSDECVMQIEDEIWQRIRAAKVWDKDAKLEDFQIKAAGNGYVLINLKTRRAQLVYDEFSELHDLEQLFPERYGWK